MTSADSSAQPHQPPMTPALPPAVLAHILQHVPQQQRLPACALVCTDWAAAAALATISIDVCMSASGKLPSFRFWLAKHAKQVDASAGLLQHASTVQRPPCLAVLQHASTAAAPPGQHSSPLPKLRELKISYCHVSTVQPILQLSRLTSLTSLDLNSVTVGSSIQSAQVDAAAMRELGRALCSALPRLPQLQAFHLHAEVPGAEQRSVMQQLSTLKSLRSLHVMIPNAAGRTADLVTALPAGLTHLYVCDWRGQSSADAPQPDLFPARLRELSGLRELVLYQVEFYASLLSCMTGLQTLQLEDCHVLPAGRDTTAAAALAAAADLLAAVGRMTQLRVLDNSNYDAPDLIRGGRISAAPPAAYAALTASSQLQELALVSLDELPLPSGAVQHLFPTGRVLPHLTSLFLEGRSSLGGPALDESGQSGFMSACELGAVFAACPALAALHICNALKCGDPTPLLQLPRSVTDLSVGGEALGDAAAAMVAQLTQLRCLSWEGSPDLTDVGLQQLTALQGLRYLRMYSNWGLSPRVLDDEMSVEEGGCDTLDLWQVEPPVWQQLCDRCDKSPVLALQRLQQHKQDKVQLQQQNAALQTQAATLQERNAHLQQQVEQLEQQGLAAQQENAALQQQVERGQQQLSEAQQYTAQLEQRLRDARLMQ